MTANPRLVKELQKLDQEAIVVIKNSDTEVHPTLSVVEEDEGIHDLDGWDLLSQWRDLKEMEECYDDTLAFHSIVVLE